MFLKYKDIQAIYTKTSLLQRQPKIIPIEELTYEALIEKKGAKNNDQKTKIEEGTEKVVETEEKEGDKKEDKEFLYISTSDGKVVAMNRSDVVKVGSCRLNVMLYYDNTKLVIIFSDILCISNPTIS